MLEYSVSVEHMDDDDEYDEEEEEEEDGPRQTEMSVEDLVSIMKDACVLLRQAKEEGVDDFDIILEQVDDLIRRAISGRLEMGSTGITSFAHTPDALVKDPWYDRMYLESSRLELIRPNSSTHFYRLERDMYMSFIAHLGMDPRKVDGMCQWQCIIRLYRSYPILEFIADSSSPLDPWRKEEQPHAQTTSLSRFRPGVEFPASSTHPHANFVFQARCEINNDTIREGGKLRISSDGSYMAMNTRGGYKSRDPVISYWKTRRNSEEFEHKSFVPPLAHLVVDHVIDDSRRLLFVADRERVKSYTYGKERKAMHTLDSSAAYGTGPLALLSNGRIARSGTGSALIWNIDELETHYAPGSNDFHKIGEGTYKGFEDSWREEGCKQELSRGSIPHATVSYAIPDLLPRVWDYHAPSGLMLIGEDPRDSERCDCISMDLEHGGKVVTRFIGHGDQVEAFSLSDEDPNVFLTASADGYARLWDVRDNLPVLTFDVEGGSASCNSALFIHLDSLPGEYPGTHALRRVLTSL